MKRNSNSEKLNFNFNGESSLDNNGLTWKRGKLIGKGNFGSVYLAKIFKTPLSRPESMAVKSAELSLSYTLQKKTEILLELRGSPYIIYCYGDETTITRNDRKVFYNLKLEYAAGGTLADVIEKSRGKGLPEYDVIRYTRSIFQGIECVHSHGYVHCDLKPENVLLVKPMVGNCLALVIGDFGLAKRGSEEMKPSPTINGTPYYMAPESVMFRIEEASCDIWALGCIVFEMLTGKKVWPGLKKVEIFKSIRESREVEIPDSVSEEAKSFLKMCFERNHLVRLSAKKLLSHPFVWGDVLAEQRMNLAALKLKDDGVKMKCNDMFSDPFLKLGVPAGLLKL